MPIRMFAHDELFHETGPEESLDYLWGRLQDRDLSGEEALALLSVVHRQLGAERAGDPKVYFAYTRFMESLSRELPLVHDYVVARWIENRRSSLRPGRPTGERFVLDAAYEEGQAATQPARAMAAETAPVAFLPAAGISGRTAEEPQEPGEPDEEDDTVPVRAAYERGAAPEAAEDPEAASEVQDEEEAPGDADGEQDDLDELADQEEVSEGEGARSDAEGTEGGPGEAPAGEEVGGEDEPGEPEQSDAEPDETAIEGAGDKPEVEEGEWPAEESLEPPEPTEEMEGEGDEPSPED